MEASNQFGRRLVFDAELQAGSIGIVNTDMCISAPDGQVIPLRDVLTVLHTSIFWPPLARPLRSQSSVATRTLTLLFDVATPHHINHSTAMATRLSSHKDFVELVSRRLSTLL